MRYCLLSRLTTLASVAKQTVHSAAAASTFASFRNLNVQAVCLRLRALRERRISALSAICLFCDGHLGEFFALASSCGTEGDDKDKDTTPVCLGGDEDWYAIHLDPGQPLSISIAFIHDMTVTFQ